MFCTKCGNPIGPEDQFCAVCGAKRKSAAEPQQTGSGNEQIGNGSLFITDPLSLEDESRGTESAEQEIPGNDPQEEVPQEIVGKNKNPFIGLITKSEKKKNKAKLEKKTKILKAILQLMFFVGPLVMAIPFYGVDRGDIDRAINSGSVSQFDVAAEAVFNGRDSYVLSATKIGEIGEIGGAQYIVLVAIIVTLLGVVLLANWKWFGGFLIVAGFFFYVFAEISMVNGYEKYYNTTVVELMKEKDPGQVTLNYDQQVEEAAQYRAEVKAEWPKPEFFKLGSYKFGFYLMIIMCGVSLCFAILLIKQTKSDATPQLMGT